MIKGRTVINLASNVGFFLLNIVVSLWMVSYLIKTLGVSLYGVVPLAVTLASYFNVITVGLNMSVGRHLTVALENRDHSKVSKIFNSSFWASCVIAAGMLFIGVGFQSSISNWIDVPVGYGEDIGWLFLCVIASLAVTTIGTTFLTISYSRNRFDLQNFGNVVGLLVRVAITVGAFGFYHASLWFVGLGLLGAALAVFCVGFWSARYLMPSIRLRISDFSYPTLREISSTGVWVFIGQIGTILLVNIDLLVINKISGATDAGRYATVLQWSILLRNFAMVVSGVFGPSILAAYSRGDSDYLVMYVRRSVRFMGFIIALPVGLICGFSTPLLNVWLGPTFVGLAGVLVVVVSHLAVNLAYLPLHHISIATNNVKWPGVSQIIAGMANLALAVLLGERYGLYGVAVAGAVVLFARNICYTSIYAALLLEKPWWFFLGQTLPVFLLTSLVGVCAFGLSKYLTFNSWMSLMGGGLLVSIIYLASLWVVVFGSDEKRAIEDEIGKSLSRLGLR